MEAVNVEHKKKMKKVPKLRFPEFEGEWSIIKLGDEVTKIGSGVTPRGGSEVYTDTGVLFIRSQNVNHDRLILEDVTYIPEDIHVQMKSSEVHPSDILLNITGASIGRSCIVPDDFFIGNVNQHVCIIRLKNGHVSKFYQAFLSSHKGQELVYQGQAGGGREGLNFQSIRSFKIGVPISPEQQKIAAFLSAVDQKIQQLTRKKELLEQYKKGMMQRLFAVCKKSNYELRIMNDEFITSLRFRDENGNDYTEWNERKLSELLYESKSRNYDLKYNKNDVLSVSGDYGIVNQIEFQGRSFAGTSVANYHIVEIGDIVYTKSPLKANPFGIIKVNKGKPGIVSTLYAVYKCKETALGVYLDYYFQLDDKVNGYLRPLVHKGAKNDMKISNSRVLIDTIWIPERNEQNRIVEFLQHLDKKIDKVTYQLYQTQQFKKGLLQQMFV